MARSRHQPEWALRLLAACQLPAREKNKLASALREQGVCALSHFAPNAAQHALAQRQLEALALLGIDIIPLWRFPLPLQHVPSAPVALFVRGSSDIFANKSFVSLVGSRRASPSCLLWANLMGDRLTKQGKTIVSGGARGIDTAAHQGALQAGGTTLAILGSAIDRPYPSSNKPLFTAVLAQGGALVSEHPPLSQTYASHHALRNRLIAALGEVLYIAEAAQTSGTLGTARWARRLGRPIYVAPPKVGGVREGLDLLLGCGWAALAPD